jgi:hypothetical protein
MAKVKPVKPVNLNPKFKWSDLLDPATVKPKKYSREGRNLCDRRLRRQRKVYLCRMRILNVTIVPEPKTPPRI